MRNPQRRAAVQRPDRQRPRRPADGARPGHRARRRRRPRRPTASATARESQDKLPGDRRPDAAGVPATASCAGTSTASTSTSGPSASTCGARGRRRGEPQLFDSARRGGPLRPRRGARGAATPRPRRRGASGTSASTQLGTLYPTRGAGDRRARRLPVRRARAGHADRERRRSASSDVPVGVPLEPGLACVTAHDHRRTSPGSATSRSAATSSRTTTAGASSRTSSSAASSCRRAASRSACKLNAKKIRRYRKIAKRELAQGAEQRHGPHRRRHRAHR